MKVNAKCHNYSGCLLAYRGEEVHLEAGAPMVCPECGKAVTASASPTSKMVKVGAGVVALAALTAVAWFLGRPLLTNKTAADSTPAPTPVSVATPAGAPRADAPKVAKKGATPAPPSDTGNSAPPPLAITAPPRLDLDSNAGNNKKVKAEVLKRIDLMPNVSQANKDRLYNSVERAQSMGLILTIPFAAGKTALAANDIAPLKAQLDSPDVMKLRDVPTAVFVILGFADPKGDEKKNIELSQARADSVLANMRDKCGVQNVMHAVAMGGSTLVDAQNLEKNRIVEIWAVLP